MANEPEVRGEGVGVDDTLLESIMYLVHYLMALLLKICSWEGASVSKAGILGHNTHITSLPFIPLACSILPPSDHEMIPLTLAGDLANNGQPTNVPILPSKNV